MQEQTGQGTTGALQPHIPLRVYVLHSSNSHKRGHYCYSAGAGRHRHAQLGD